MKSVAKLVRQPFAIFSLITAVLLCGMAQHEGSSSHAREVQNDNGRSLEVLAPATIFIWPGDVFMDSLNCATWNTPQIPDSLERYTPLTIAACQDTSNHDVAGVIVEIKCSSDSPLVDANWSVIGDDSTVPFSMHANLWSGSLYAMDRVPLVGISYDVVARTTDHDGITLTWQNFVNHGTGATWQEKWQSLIDTHDVKRFRTVDHTAPIAHSLTPVPDQTPDSSVIFLTGIVSLSAVVEEPDVASVTFAVRQQGVGGPWTTIERINTPSGSDTFRLDDNHQWDTELLNGAYTLGAFAQDSIGNMDGDLTGVGAGPAHPLSIFVDNERPRARVESVHRGNQALADLDSLERGAPYTFDISASDNFGLRQVALYYRSAHGSPGAWIPIDSNRTWPYTVQWTIPPALVVGWTYDFAAVATDLVHLTDLRDSVGQYQVDTSFVVVDHEANVSLYTIGGQRAETLPHVNGSNVILVAHSDSSLDNVRFEMIRGGNLTVIGTVPNPLGTTVWTLNGWNVMAIPQGAAQLIAVGSADLGGNLVTLATDTANIVIDRTLSVRVTDVQPHSRGLLGGFCEFANNPIVTGTLWMRFDSTSSVSISALFFDWKATADPNDSLHWHFIGQAVFDDSSRRWAYAWEDTSFACGLISLRARVHDNAVPVPNDTTIVFADSVRMDNCPPIVAITNINGNPAPNNMNIGRGEIETITATVADSFGNGANSAIDSVAFYYSRLSLTMNVPSDWVYIGSDTNGEPWQTSWDTGALLPGVLELHAVAWDHAGNCGQGAVDVNLVDQYPQRAWIVGVFDDTLVGCPDRLWAVTEDGPTNRTTRVEFEYSADTARTWIHLGETGANTPYCDANLAINTWSWPLELDSIPQSALFRAVATDINNNYDPTPPRFRRTDLTASNQPAIFDEDWARVHVTPGQFHWLFGVLKGADPTCFVYGGLVCASPVQGDTTQSAGRLDTLTRPCILNNHYGSVTVFSGSQIAHDSASYMVLTTHQLAIHLLTANGGTNGTVTSEDRRLQMMVPHNGVSGDGTEWFEPAQDTSHAIPPSQPYLRLLSTVENVITKGVAAGTQASAFRMFFDATTLLPNDTVVVAEYWDQSLRMWSERGIAVEARHIDRVHADSSFVDFSLVPNWSTSSDHPGCPSKLRLAVFHSTIRPISANVHFASATCPSIPDSSHFGLDTNGVRTDCRPTFWITLGQGGVADTAVLDVFIDTIRVVQNGIPMSHAFTVRADTVSNSVFVTFASRADTVAPWFGCLPAGRHSTQFVVDNERTAVTPFYVDVSGPNVHATPEYFAHSLTVTADITDLDSGVDTTTMEARLRNCANSSDPRFVRIGAEGMRFVPLASNRGYRATFTVPWEQVQFMFPDTFPRPADQLCVTWRAANKVCLHSDSTNYLYTVDVMPPIVTAISPVGPGGREDTLIYGARPTIEVVVNDSARNGSGASGLNLGQLQLTIDNHTYTFADTVNAALNFHLIAPNSHNADIRFGGIGSGLPTDPYYRPGDHHVTVIAPDSVGNLGAVPFSWDYYIRASGPIIAFDTTTHVCGTWFNPSRSDTFRFCVDSLSGVPIAANGIQYSVYTISNHQLIAGPTVVNPQNTAHQCVTVTLAGSFPSGATGVEIVVDAWNSLYNPAADSLNGITHSRQTFWADNHPPIVLTHIPATDSLLSRNDPIDLVVTFSDDFPDSSRALLSKHRGSRTLDENGSGVTPERTMMTIIPPSGVPIYVSPDSATHFSELDAAHARYTLPAGQTPGDYHVTIRLEDCVGNVGDFLWTFRVRGLGPEIAFQPPPPGLSCQWNSDWNPSNLLYLRATVHERDSANVDASGIRVDILRAYHCDAGICQDTLLSNAPFLIIGEQPDPNNTNQTFTIADSFHLDPGATGTEARILITATNANRVSTSLLQPWVIDNTPPVITPVSPHPDAVEPVGQPVTISADLSDVSGALAVVLPGGGATKLPATLRGLKPVRRGANGRSTVDDGKPFTPDTRQAVARRGSGNLDGNSGVDSTCVTLHLRYHVNGNDRDLTALAVRTSSNITFTDTLAEGAYTATVTACDRVCNSSTVNWDFSVGRQTTPGDTIPPVIRLISPPNDAALPYHVTPTFVVQFTDAPGGELDSTSIHVRLETINGVPVTGNVTIAFADNLRTATASLSTGPLNPGAYTLFASGSDMGGNRADAAFQYSVRDTILSPGNPQLGDSSAYNYPNPFGPLPNDGGGMTRFSLPATGGALVQIKIYDFAGMFVNTVFDGVLPQTGFEPVWRAQNARGEQVASGVYLAHIRLSAGGVSREQIVKVAFKKK